MSRSELLCKNVQTIMYHYHIWSLIQDVKKVRVDFASSNRQKEIKRKMKTPFKAKPDDKTFCPNLNREVSVDAWCHGWTFKNELCNNADECEPYLQYTERRLLESRAKCRKIRLPPKIYAKIEECARAKGLSVDQFAIGVILKNVKEVKAHG